MSQEDDSNRVFRFLLEFSLPLLVGVFVALCWANLDHASYEHFLHWKPFGDVAVFGHPVTFHFLVDDIFMVFFFGIAAKEITESALPGGSLNPMRQAINPLFATIGGVLGPVLVFFVGLWLCFQLGVYAPPDDAVQLSRGWGIPTATDIALAWLVARTVFGKTHPAVAFLLLLAVADDAIGLVIIAIFYGDPQVPAEPVYLGLVLLGMLVAYGLRRARVRQWPVYIGIAGPLSWSGLMLAHLHPALALAVIVPFLPAPSRDTGLFVDTDEVDEMGEPLAQLLQMEHTPLHQFEHDTKTFVDFGLFFFALANAGVELAGIGPMTWLVFAALVVGKTIGIGGLGLLGARLGFPLPDGMKMPDLLMSGFIAALGLTVALFVASAAFVDPMLRGQAKMGALFSGFVGIAAVLLGKALGFGAEEAAEEGDTRAESDSGASGH